MKKIIKNANAFTLVELLVTMAIIGILAGVVLISMSTYGKKARSTKMLTQISSAIPSMISCWGNGGSPNNPVNDGSGKGVGGNPICSFSGVDSTGYGNWPAIGSVGPSDLSKYNYAGRSFTSSTNWIIRIISSSSNDDVAICCNSTINGCKITGPASDAGNCSAIYNP